MNLFNRLLRPLLLPPGCLILLLTLVVWLMPRHPRAARWLCSLTAGGLLVLSLPVTALWLLSTLSSQPPVTPGQLQAFAPQAVVVLSSGGFPEQTEMEGSGVNDSSLARTYYGVFLAGRLNLPLLFTGGGWQGFGVASAMADAAVRMGVPRERIWTETASIDTWQNAQLSERLLTTRGIRRVALVTEQWHMRRSVLAFSHTGLQVQPAPYNTDLFTPLDSGVLAWTPSKSALFQSSRCLEEWLGLAWYALRYR